jgi:AraC-like DNA-binding protein
MARCTLHARLPDGIPTNTARMGKYTWPDDAAAPAILLHNDFDLFRVVGGRASLEFRDGTRLSAGKDEFMILPPFVTGWIGQEQRLLVFWYCHFGFRPAISPGAGAAHRPIDVPMTFSADEAPGVARAYRRLAEVDPAAPLASWRGEGLLVELVTELAAFAQRRPPGKRDRLFESAGHQDQRVAELCWQVERDPSRAWRVAELATSVGLSPSRLHALFRSATGESLKAFIVKTRLRRALVLLRDRGTVAPSIKEVSAACGFTSQHYFSRQFRQLFRVSPMAYRAGARL